jgi:hypothetical protein
MKKLLILCLVLAACTKEVDIEPSICPVHQTEMRKQRVSIQYGLIALLQPYESDKERLFPNCDDPVFGGCSIMFDKNGFMDRMDKYVCETCNHERDAWVNNPMRDRNAIPYYWDQDEVPY